MKTGKTYQCDRATEKEREREWIRGEREVALVERGNGMGRNDEINT
jgi:hypothetical protein